MKNLFGGILGAIVACTFISFMNLTPLHAYPEPFNQIWFLLDGPRFLENAILMLSNPQSIAGLLTSLCGAGIILSLFSKTPGNAIRTTLWMGASLGSFYLASVLLVDPVFWTSIDRNIVLVMLYIQNILVSLFSLIVTIPLVRVRRWLGNRGPALVPPKIETKCECGAVFKSRPMICSECGKVLNHLSTLSADTATQ